MTHHSIFDLLLYFSIGQIFISSDILALALLPLGFLLFKYWGFRTYRRPLPILDLDADALATPGVSVEIGNPGYHKTHFNAVEIDSPILRFSLHFFQSLWIAAVSKVINQVNTSWTMLRIDVVIFDSSIRLLNYLLKLRYELRVDCIWV
jgi:hypothetical protein